MRRRNPHSRDGLPPGPRAPRAWQFAQYQLRPLDYAEACAARYGGVFTWRLPPHDELVVATDPRDVRTILLHAHGRFGGASATRVRPIVGAGSMMLMEDEPHRALRRRMQPAFHGALAERWSERIAAIAEAELARVPAGRPVEMYGPLRRIAIQATCELTFGPERSAERAALCEQIASGQDPRLALLLWFPGLWSRSGRLSPARSLRRRRELVRGLIHREIALRRADPRLGERDDVLSLLLAAAAADEPPPSDAALHDQVLGLLLAGPDTTASTIAWGLERLSRTPHARERLLGELDAGAPAYLDAVLSETMRVRPPVLEVPRTASAALELGGYRIAARTPVSAMVGVTQRRADLWDEPLAFRPERFLNGRAAPFAYAPFGGGVRHCIGAALAMLSARVTLQTVLRRHVPDAAPGREEGFRPAGVSARPARGARVVLRPRGGSAHLPLDPAREVPLG